MRRGTVPGIAPVLPSYNEAIRHPPTPSPERAAHEKFAEDVTTFGGYEYMLERRLSTRMALERWNRAIRDILGGAAAGTSVVDIGCGDGKLTRWFHDTFAPRLTVGVEPVGEAVESARERYGAEAVRFEEGNAYRLPFADGEFDFAVLREVLHHMDDPARGLEEAARVAGRLLVLEPNGYNPVLRIIEKTSRYHREHHERSLLPRVLVAGLARAGYTVEARRYFGLVPIFSPDWLARCMRAIEPVVEPLAPLNRFACGSVILLARR